MKSKNSQISLQIILFSAIFVFIITIFINWFYLTFQYSLKEYYKSTALYIAESGIEYYRWRLNHNPLDYQNINSPLVQNFYDKNGRFLGKYTLEITPPATGSTIVTIKSKGEIDSNPPIEKIVKVKVGRPSLAKYAIIVNENVRFGEGTEVYGEIYSNGGIRFDGLAHNLVSSAMESYDDPDHSGGYEFGVHTHIPPVDPLPPSSVPVRSDIFKAGRKFPVPRLDFNMLTLDLAEIKNMASSSGFYWANSEGYGYELVIKPNNKFDLYKVTRIKSSGLSCSNLTWTIYSTSSLIRDRDLPDNGVMFFEDNLWVRGQINNRRVTIAVGRFPDQENTRPRIIVNQSLRYTNYDGSDAISLISQGDLLIGLESENDIRIDAALVSQEGFIGRPYYSNGCGTFYLRNSLTSYGMIASNKRYGFAWVCRGNTYCSGYRYRNLIYDSNLFYRPPPYFPLASDFYQIIDYEEIK